MKELKIIGAIIITFFIAFATSALLEIDFFKSKWPRYAAVVILMIVELIIGFMYVKSEASNIKND